MDSRPSDETLLLAVAERDMGAFRTLYERHAGWLAIRLARRCNDRDLVADAIGDSAAAREACATALGGPRVDRWGFLAGVTGLLASSPRGPGSRASSAASGHMVMRREGHTA
jgi:hypothetical protein